MQLNWTIRAIKARQKAIHYLAQHNFLSARRQLREVMRQTELLGQRPHLGRHGRVPDTRELVISRTSFLVIYRIDTQAGRIDILDFIHSAQQWPPGA